MILNFNVDIVSSQIVETPIIDYVTVDHLTGNPVVEWLIDEPNLISGYSIKRYIYSCPNSNFAPNSFHTINIIEDPLQSMYEDISTDCPAETGNRKEIYGIIAFRIDGEDTIRSSIDALHQTIYLQAEFDYCNKQNILSWNNYISWGTDFDHYEIYCKESSGAYLLIGTSAYNDTVFYHSNLDYDTDYEYYIRAVRNDGTESLSNIREIYTQTIVMPTFIDADSLVVNDEVNLQFSVDANSETDRYILYKSFNKTGIYDSIDGIIHNNEKVLKFSDSYNNNINYYYLAAIDYCGNEIFKSQVVSNIKLNVDKSESGEKLNLLKWKYDSGGEFKVFRCDNDKTNCLLVNETFDSDYSDNIQSVFENQFNNHTSDGVFCYQIQTNDNSFVNISNSECVSYEETIFMATAFNPRSNVDENKVFKPKIAFISDYELVVYGNFGDIIFQTKNPGIGWDGKLPNGELAKRAAYLYFVSYTNSFGKHIKQKGIVSLVY